jgi:hypothetical protein
MTWPPGSQFDPSPYRPPQHAPEPWPREPWQPPGPAPMPAVWPFYAIYCVVLALVYLGTIALGAFFIVQAEMLAEHDRDIDDPLFFVIMGGAFIAISLPLAILFAAGPLAPRNRFGWILGIVAIAIGLTSGCTMLASVPLLVFWLQKGVKRYYRVE